MRKKRRKKRLNKSLHGLSRNLAVRPAVLFASPKPFHKLVDFRRAVISVKRVKQRIA
jgi:hypothetical protein